MSHLNALRPLTRGVEVYVLFRWMSQTLPRKQEYTEQLVELGSNMVDDLFSRYRAYAISRLLLQHDVMIPNPLHVHSIALLDAYILFRCFKEWAQHCYSYKKHKVIMNQFRKKTFIRQLYTLSNRREQQYNKIVIHIDKRRKLKLRLLFAQWSIFTSAVFKEQRAIIFDKILIKNERMYKHRERSLLSRHVSRWKVLFFKKERMNTLCMKLIRKRWTNILSVSLGAWSSIFTERYRLTLCAKRVSIGFKKRKLWLMWCIWKYLFSTTQRGKHMQE